MSSEMFKLNIKDFAKGLVTAIVTALVVFLAEAMQVPGFDFVTFDWATLLSVAASAFIAYLAKNYFSDKEGRVFGKIG